MSLVLRHRPDLLGLELDREGFADVDVREFAERISRLRGMGWVRPEHVLRVIAGDPKGRFEVRGGRVRAAYGHSLPVDPPGPPISDPPDELYHGTPRRSLPSILRRGLLPMGRRFVHLSADPGLALEAARRRGPHAALLRVDAAGMVSAGLPIWRASPWSTWRSGSPRSS